MLTRIGAFVLGAACGLGFFAAAAYLYDPPTPFYDRWDSRFSGTIASHDPVRRTLVVRMQSVFPDGESGLVRFVYTGNTEWSSLAYLLRDGAVESRQIETGGNPPQLPEGTFVTVARDVTSKNEWRASSVAFLRRIEL